MENIIRKDMVKNFAMYYGLSRHNRITKEQLAEFCNEKSKYENMIKSFMNHDDIKEIEEIILSQENFIKCDLDEILIPVYIKHDNMDKFDIWENIGDENYLEHGGIFVKYDIEVGGRNYYVYRLTHKENEYDYIIYYGYVDLDDDWINWEGISECVGELEQCNDKVLASNVANYYHYETFWNECETYKCKEDVRERLIDLDIINE